MSAQQQPPLLRHDTEAPPALTASGLMDSVRELRGSGPFRPPEICVLEFDGDLTDWLVAQGRAVQLSGWPCFHTKMYVVDCEGVPVGIVDRTIGGPYAVLVAEQLQAAGARLIVGLTSAGRVSSELPLPCLVVATSAIRDEGTSFHYLPPGESVDAPAQIAGHFAEALRATRWPVRTGCVWTTDAPYRETEGAILFWRSRGVLAVEMQAASLFAFGAARQAAVAVVARVSNAIDHTGEQFDTGTEEDGWQALLAIARAGAAYLDAGAALPGRELHD
ncbi:MAG: nucleoside phosphorylase [Acidobacteria bacterium]|nr:nucleoside phosphorylase [Acidobacteriota bacterium]